MKLLPSMVAIATLMLALVSTGAAAYYLPGYPVPHADKGPVDVMVNTLRSSMTFTPYNYYDLPLCRPKVITTKNELIGEVMFGDMMHNSPYALRMKQNESCVLLECQPDDNARLKQNIDQLETFINQEYRAGISIDNLAAYTSTSAYLRKLCDANIGNIPDRWKKFESKRGYALGLSKACTGGVTKINNHLHFNVKFHKRAEGEFTVVGLSVLPFSINHQDGGRGCNDALTLEAMANAEPLTTDQIRAGKKPYWSFSVNWEESDRDWTTRWDDYLNTSTADNNPRVHWTMIINGLLIAMCVGTLAGMVLLRTLHKECNRYNSEDPDERQNEMGWKLVHADVFRPPTHASFLTICVSTGVQIVLLSICILFFALLGFMAPSDRGVLLTTLVLLFVLLSFVQGYCAGRMLMFFDAKQWKTIFGCAMFYTGTVFTVWFINDMLNWSAGASDAVGWKVMLTLIGLVFAVTVPLAVFGANFAFRQGKMEMKIKVGKLAREIPLQRWYHSPPFVYIFPPLIPMSILFLELKFILSSLWEGMVYYVFGFLALVFLVWFFTTILTTIIAMYYQLTFEDWRWWWRSILVPGCFGLHIFLYSVYWYFSYLSIKTALGTWIYFSYMALISLAYGLASGAIGFVSAFLFIWKIYGSIKLD